VSKSIIVMLRLVSDPTTWYWPLFDICSSLRYNTWL